MLIEYPLRGWPNAASVSNTPGSDVADGVLDVLPGLFQFALVSARYVCQRAVGNAERNSARAAWSCSLNEVPPSTLREAR